MRSVIIVGAGIVGLSTAWFLQERGVEVRVVDRGEVGLGASWGNAGWIAPALTLPLPEPAIFRYGVRAVVDPRSPVYVPLAADPKLLRFLTDFAWHSTPPKWRRNMKTFAEINRWSLDSFDRLADGGVADRTITAEPFLTAFTSERDRDVLRHEFAEIEKRGGEVDFRLISGDEVRAIEPAVSGLVTHGIRVSGQRYINPPLFVRALAEAVEARGGTILTHTTVADVADLGSGVTVTVARPATEGALPEAEELAADAVVLATGTWLGGLARRFGVKTLVQAGRGYSFSVRPEVVPEHPIYFAAQRVACTPLGDRLRVGGMMEFRAADAPPDPRRITTLVEAARPLFTGVDWDAREDEWVGSRPCTPDGLPLVGVTRSPRVHVAGGHGMWGVTLGPLTGRVLADAMTGRPRHPLLDAFDPLR
ncbi:FAD-binding oxidoreductase [Salinibacterium sp. SYSU T00001]|uniref:NAD(P)/FAD-dependent oxidoreductase n=1 Tax=Homoserinimonas sedimenticola TaxID=2986805 RepID=UPI002235F1FF|nr:FAD-dependent oxidoreductase [Salinibacterium sedimenticola]MCW4385546.1 FAD-binding oxidoreductase [Salinibacterium sedimenticola]